MSLVLVLVFAEVHKAICVIFLDTIIDRCEKMLPNFGRQSKGFIMAYEKSYRSVFSNLHEFLTIL